MIHFCEAEGMEFDKSEGRKDMEKIFGKPKEGLFEFLYGEQKIPIWRTKNKFKTCPIHTPK